MFLNGYIFYFKVKISFFFKCLVGQIVRFEIVKVTGKCKDKNVSRDTINVTHVFQDDCNFITSLLLFIY